MPDDVEFYECPYEDCDFWSLTSDGLHGHLTVHARDTRDALPED